MGLLSPSVSLTRYRVEGTSDTPLKEVVYRGLRQHAMPAVEDEGAEKTMGWTAFKDPYQSDFEGYSFVFGNYFAFSLRIDKKSISANLVQKYVAIETARKLAASDRDFLSRNEKKMIREHVLSMLQLRIPATPNIYNILWNYQTSTLLFFTTLKNPNEEIEGLFSASFNLRLIRLFPYTLADLACGLSESERDELHNLSPTQWSA